MGAAVVAGCKAPPVLQSGKERLDCVTLAIQPLAVMDWFPAAATGWEARRDALLGQHLTDCVPVLPLIPHHRGRRRQVFAHPIRTGEVTALPLLRWSRRGPPLLSQTPWSLLSCPPWCHHQAGYPPFVEAGRRGMGFDVSGVNHQHLWLWGIGRLCGASDADNSEKISSNTPLSHQRRQLLTLLGVTDPHAELAGHALI